MSPTLIRPLLIFSILTTSAFAANKVPPAATVLQESFDLSKSMQPENRAFLLVRLTDASTDIASAQATEEWTKELWKLAFTLPRGWNRIATQKNALVPLARVNPVLAFKQLSKVERPVPHEGEFTEDLRADAAASIFLPYYRSGDGNALRKIKKEAQDIGDTGEYPFRAVGLIIEELFKTQAPQQTANELFQQALNYYTRKSVFLDADDQFFQLLQLARFGVSDSVFSAGLHEFVGHLQSSESRQPRSFAAEVHTVDGVYSFEDQKLLLLFRIFPTVARVDRGLSIKLAAKYEILQHANTEIEGISASGVIGGTGALSGSAIDKRAQERLLLRRIEHLKSTDPVAALRDAKLVQSEPDRSAAVASIIPTLTDVDRILANDAYLELTQAVDRLPDGRPRLGGLVASAKAACQAGYDSSCTDYVAQALDYGLQFFADNVQVKKQALSQKQNGFLELSDVSEVGAEYSPEQTLTRIRAVDDTGLRSYLLLAAAKGINRREHAEMASAGVRHPIQR